MSFFGCVIMVVQISWKHGFTGRWEASGRETYFRKKKCKDDYVGETGRRKAKRTGEHAGTDKQSEILKHTQKTKHPQAKEEGFEILATNYPNRTKRKLAEAMFIRDLKPTLNRQEDSYKLHLFA